MRLSILEHAAAERFIGPEQRAMILVDEYPGNLLRRLESYRPSTADRAAQAWLLAKAEEFYI